MSHRKILFICLLSIFYLTANAQKEYNPYAPIGKKGKIVTLSKGKYVETFDTDTLQRIGSVILNIRTREVVILLNTDSLYGIYSDNSSSSRWYSIDPKADEFTSYSPYNFVMNNPLRFVDPDGQAPQDWIRVGKKTFFDKNVNSQEQATAKYGSDAKDLGKTFKEKDATYYADGSAFFKNETKAWNFMWENSNYGQGAANETENMAWVTNTGVAVLPTEGTTADGREFKNDKNTSEVMVYKTEGKGDNLTVDFHGTKLKPTAFAHTHAWSSSMAITYHSGEDIAMTKQLGKKSVVLSHTNVYVASPTNPGTVVNVGPLKNFLTGAAVIIPNLKKIK